MERNTRPNLAFAPGKIENLPEDIGYYGKFYSVAIIPIRYKKLAN